MALRLNLWAGGSPLWSAAGSWAVADATGSLVSTSTSTTTLTTGNLDSAVFAPGAVTVDGVALRLGSRATGSPTNTITVTLRNSTDAVDVAAVTANVSDLPACSTSEDEGGWAFFKFAASHLLLAGKNYIIRVTLSATSTAVALRTNGTANNWQRLLRTTTTGAPAAGDDLFICGELDGSASPATLTTTGITYDGTAATDYGSASTSLLTPAISVSFGGILVFQATAATNYVLRVSGNLIIFSKGTSGTGAMLQIKGTAGASGLGFPQTSTAVIEFDCAADGDFGLVVKNVGSAEIYGAERTGVKEVSQVRLTADHAAAATTINVDADTGWLAADEVALAGTTRPGGVQYERRVLNANAGAASFVITAGLTNAHLGTGDMIAAVILLTRNVEIRSVSTTAVSFMRIGPTSTVWLFWVSLRYVGHSLPGKRGLEVETTPSGLFQSDHMVVQDSDSYGVYFLSGAHDGWTVSNLSLYNICRSGIARAGIYIGLSATPPTWSLTRVVAIGAAVASTPGIDFDTSALGTCTHLTVSGFGIGVRFAATAALANGGTISGHLRLYANSNEGLYIAGVTTGLTVSGTFESWRNAGSGLYLSGVLQDFVASGGGWVGGNFLYNIQIRNSVMFARFETVDFGADTTAFTSWNISMGSNLTAQGVHFEFNACKFSQVTGTRAACSTDFALAAVTALNYFDILLRNCLLAAATEVQVSAWNARSSLRSAVHDQTAGLHKCWGAYGTLEIETTTVDVSPSMKLSPTGGTTALQVGLHIPGAGFMVPILSGATATITVKVQKDASYNGATMPQLVLLRNVQCGIAADTVLDTHVAAAGVWETLSGTTAAVSADGVLEFVVRGYGTAGAFFVDTWTAS